MFQPPDDFDSNPNPFSNKANKESKLEDLAPEELEDVSPEDLAYRKQELGRILIWLIGLGIGLGIIVVIIIGIIMTKFGLTERPDQIKPQPLKPQHEQVDKT